jgi:hypothetical protein
MNDASRKALQTLAGILCGATACLFLACTLNVAGSATEGGNVEVAGVIVDSNGRPVKGADIVLRSSNFLKDTSGAVPPRNIAADVVTDNNGHFSIDSIYAGEYCITASSGDSLAVLIKFGAKPSDTVFLDTTPLAPSAEIKGTVVCQGATVSAMFVQVYGLDKIARVDNATGAFRLFSVPAGAFRLQVLTSSSQFTPLVIPDVFCAQGEKKTLDTITIASFGNENYSLWANTASVTVNTTASGANVSGTVANFPLLVRLRSPAFTFGQFQTDGHDVRFANRKGKHLPFEIERFDPYGGIADIWVLADTIQANDTTTFTMYWGNPNAVAHSFSTMVFDTAFGYASVWHCNDMALNDRIDATYNANSALPLTNYEGDEGTYGIIGGCDSLDDNDDRLKAQNIDVKAEITIDMWVNICEPTTGLRQYFLSKAASSHGKAPVFGLLYNEKGELAMNISAGNKADSISGGPVPMNAWCYVAGTYDGAILKVYVDGVLQNAKAVTGMVDSTWNNVYIGYFDKLSQKLHGKIDEVRVRRNAVTADWIKLTYENQKGNATMVKIGK